MRWGQEMRIVDWDGQEMGIGVGRRYGEQEKGDWRWGLEVGIAVGGWRWEQKKSLELGNKMKAGTRDG